jgi:hypothetical protein
MVCNASQGRPTEKLEKKRRKKKEERIETKQKLEALKWRRLRDREKEGCKEKDNRQRTIHKMEKKKRKNKNNNEEKKYQDTVSGLAFV